MFPIPRGVEFERDALFNGLIGKPLSPDHSIRMQPPGLPEIKHYPGRPSEVPTKGHHVGAARQSLVDQVPGYRRVCATAKSAVRAETARRITRTESSGDDIEIITLGTGSAVPSKYRNVSSTLLVVPNVGNILLDCGEGTLGQLRRLWQESEPRITNIYASLRLIFISHMHADHHLGLQQLLADRLKVSRSAYDKLICAV